MKQADQRSHELPDEPDLTAAELVAQSLAEPLATDTVAAADSGYGSGSQTHSPATMRYRTLSSFYNADPRRIRSREADVGLWWRATPSGPLHRAAWVNDTGELYLVRLGPAEEGGGEVEVLAHVEDRDSLEDALGGWREQCGRPRSLAWLRDHAARLRGDRSHASMISAYVSRPPR